ncbi:hypothetical protein [Paenibacillus radicis (ex Gao et al. 2016)]|uniref:Uncharacterized protein n=1 Tax=Paenibacillus radicis (ex Gao et al. 2016) TaxID=1737354 RepID=A0A917GSC2_9BACL|nr:hypothetical protein [Paenibacillus radicis (ex Gao et al. 2016)]GGG55650.1 hypothetical protein GCM10010918_05700 [Paenibacillus radicis (ex Gao et al. 2016)]
MGKYRFQWNERLRISLPVMEQDWELYDGAEQADMVERWELIRGTIPDRIMELERVIRVKQNELFEEDSFPESCRINSEIAELASRINDLQIWYRVSQELETPLSPS